MRKESFVIVTLVVMFAILHLGEARQCYSCTANEADCASPKDKQKTNCSSATTFCSTCELELKNGTVLYARSCGGLLTQENDLHCFDCNEDFCNNADAISINKIALESLAMLWVARFVLTNSY